MANNPYVNKVQLADGTSLIDISSDTVTADKLMQGYTAHDRTGAVITGTATGGSGSGAVWQDAQGYVHLSDDGDIDLQTKTVTPTESAQTVMADAGYYALEKVNVGAISSSYVGSGVTRRSSSDLTASGATVTVPSGYYESSASKAVASGTAGTPTATKGTVSNHAVTVTPSVTNITGYITGSTKTGTGVSVSASELVSGTYSVTSSGTKDVTNYASASVPSGTEGTPTATKGAVSNHSVTVTPSVTNSGGYITGSTKTGTAVTVSASELVSGTKSISANGTGIDVTNYASVDVAVPSSSPTLITKNITANGTYNASSDSADGYSSVTVNVSGGGASNYVTGTFTGTTTGAVMNITIPYSGTGYPIAIDVCVSEGASNANGTFYNTLQQYAVGVWAGNKNNTETPTYINGYSPNFFSYFCRYKSSSTTASSMGTNSGAAASTLADMDAGPSRDVVIRMKSPTVMSVYIADTSYGFMANIEYTYHIVYSG